MNTTFKTPTDFRRSLESRLKSFSVKAGQDLQQIRRKVAFERFLARIFHSELSGFVLKGGYAMELRALHARATKDIDLTCLHRVDSPDGIIEELITQELSALARNDLKDYFTFEIGDSRMDLDNAPYGGARFSVASFIDKKLFVRFQLDVEADAIIDEIELLEGSNWLDHYGIGTPKMRMISIEQQFAEKLHAYSRPRELRVNTRTKDLIDMLLLLQLRKIDVKNVRNIAQKIFKIRGTHPLPIIIELPPSEWAPLYEALARECGISLAMNEAHEELNKIFSYL